MGKRDEGRKSKVCFYLLCLPSPAAERGGRSSSFLFPAYVLIFDLVLSPTSSSLLALSSFTLDPFPSLSLPDPLLLPFLYPSTMSPLATEPLESDVLPRKQPDQGAGAPPLTNGHAKQNVTPSHDDSRPNGRLEDGFVDGPLAVQSIAQLFESSLLERLYSDSVEAKIWATAAKGLNQVRTGDAILEL